MISLYVLFHGSAGLSNELLFVLNSAIGDFVRTQCTNSRKVIPFKIDRTLPCGQIVTDGNSIWSIGKFIVANVVIVGSSVFHCVRRQYIWYAVRDRNINPTNSQKALPRAFCFGSVMYLNPWTVEIEWYSWIESQSLDVSGFDSLFSLTLLRIVINRMIAIDKVLENTAQNLFYQDVFGSK